MDEVQGYLSHQGNPSKPQSRLRTAPPGAFQYSPYQDQLPLVFVEPRHVKITTSASSPLFWVPSFRAFLTSTLQSACRVSIFTSTSVIFSFSSCLYWDTCFHSFLCFYFCFLSRDNDFCFLRFCPNYFCFISFTMIFAFTPGISGITFTTARFRKCFSDSICCVLVRC